MLLLKIAALAFAAILLAPHAAQSQQPVKIRAAWVAPVSNWASILLEKKDLAKHLGKSYVLEPLRFAGTPPMITALANNELEIANLAYSTLGIAVQNAGLDDLRVIADEFRDGQPGYYSQEYFVLKDGPIKSVKDLKGKVVATNAAGSAVDVAMRAMLRKNGLEDKRDYTVIEAPFPTMRAMLAEKKVDIVPGRAAVLARSGAAQDRNPAVQAERGDRRHADDRVDRAQVVHRQEPRRHGRFHGGYAADRALVSRPGEPEGSRRDRRRGSPSSRPSGSAGCSPRTTITAIPT